MSNERDIKNEDFGEESIERISTYLKSLRQKKRVSLEEAASFLKVNTDYLKAFEEDNFDRLPEGAYAKIFLRTYTNYLGGDSKKVLAKFNQILMEKKWQTDQVKGKKIHSEMPSQLKDWWEKGAQSSKRGWIVAIMVLIVFIGFFCNKKRQEKLVNNSFQEEKFIPAKRVESKNKDEKKLEKQVKEAQVTEKVVSKKEEKVILKATALDDVNLEMVIDGKITVKEIMKKGESRTWMADKGFVINTDNVGAVDFTFNNERFGVLGELGQPKEGIVFSKDKKE